MNASAHLSASSRLAAQIRFEWQRQRGFVLLYWCLLVAATWTMSSKQPDETLVVTHAVGLLALTILARSVLADHPRNAEAAAYCLPLGRSQVWLGKTTFLMGAVWLPWTVHQWIPLSGFGFGRRDWMAWLLYFAIESWIIGGILGVLLALGSSVNQRIAVVGGLIGIALTGIIWFDDGWWTVSGRVCGLAVGLVFLSVALGAAWWFAGRRSTGSAWLSLLGGLVVAAATLALWRWDWRQTPPARYDPGGLEVVATDESVGSDQELWNGLVLRGLPELHVASVVSLAPSAEPVTRFKSVGTLSSDFAWVTWESGKVERNFDWMKVGFRRAISRCDPTDSVWIGNNAPPERQPNLRKLWETAIEASSKHATQPWRLRLAIHSIAKMWTTPARGMIREPMRFVPAPGFRADVRVAHMDVNDHLSFKVKVLRRYPIWAALDAGEQFRPFGFPVGENMLWVWRSPMIREVQICRNDPDQTSWARDSALAMRFNRSDSVSITHPLAHMAITGLTLDEWIDGSTLELWYPEFRGIVELEIPLETVKEALRLEIARNASVQVAK